MSESRRRRKETTEGSDYSSGDESITEPVEHTYSDAGSEYESADEEDILPSGAEAIQEEDAEAPLDDDEDRKNPQYIPKRGMFYEHDDRTMPGESDEEIDSVTKNPGEVTEEGENKNFPGSNLPVVNISLGAAKVEENDISDATNKLAKKKVWKGDSERWCHDKFEELEQAPKPSEELVSTYGYDIRNEEGAPRARRRRRYGRGPTKYTRNWEDFDAYSRSSMTNSRGRGRGGRGARGGKRSPPNLNTEEFPSLPGDADESHRNEKKDFNTNRQSKDTDREEGNNLPSGAGNNRRGNFQRNGSGSNTRGSQNNQLNNSNRQNNNPNNQGYNSLTFSNQEYRKRKEEGGRGRKLGGERGARGGRKGRGGGGRGASQSEYLQQQFGGSQHKQEETAHISPMHQPPSPRQASNISPGQNKNRNYNSEEAMRPSNQISPQHSNYNNSSQKRYSSNRNTSSNRGSNYQNNSRHIFYQDAPNAAVQPSQDILNSQQGLVSSAPNSVGVAGNAMVDGQSQVVYNYPAPGGQAVALAPPSSSHPFVPQNTFPAPPLYAPTATAPTQTAPPNLVRNHTNFIPSTDHPMALTVESLTPPTHPPQFPTYHQPPYVAPTPGTQTANTNAPSEVYRNGVMYYNTQSQQAPVSSSLPKRPKAAIPIVPPPDMTKEEDVCVDPRDHYALQQLELQKLQETEKKDFISEEASFDVSELSSNDAEQEHKQTSVDEASQLVDNIKLNENESNKKSDEVLKADKVKFSEALESETTQEKTSTEL